MLKKFIYLKGDKMKQTKKSLKKSLSVFLAAVMIVTSCSVAFGLQAFGASTSCLTQLISAITTSDVMQDFADGKIEYTEGSLSVASNSTMTNSIFVDNYADYRDLLTIVNYIYEEADYLIAYGSNSHGYDGSSGSGDVRGEAMGSINRELNARLLAAMGDDYYTYKVEDFLDVVFDSYTGLLGGELDDMVYGESNQGTSSSTYSSNYSHLYFYLHIETDDVGGWLDYEGNDASDYSSMQLAIDYTVHMTRVSSKSLWTTYRGWVFTDDKANSLPDPETSTTDEVSTFTAVLNEFASVVGEVYEEYPDFTSTIEYAQSSLEAFNTTKSELDEVYYALLNYFPSWDSDVISSTLAAIYGDSYVNYSNVIATFESVDNMDSLIDAAGLWKTFQESNAAYGTFDPLAFDEEQISKDYITFKQYYDAFSIANDEVMTYFYEEYDLSEEYATNLIDNYYAYQADEIKTSLDTILTQYPQENFDSMTDEEKAVVYTLLEEQLSQTTGLSTQVMDSIFTAEEIVTYYEYKATYQEVVDSDLSFFITYTGDILDVSTDDLFAIFEIDTFTEVSQYQTSLISLQATYDQMVIDAGEDVAQAVLGELLEEANDLENIVYTVLGDRYDAQIALAKASYERYQDADGNLPDMNIMIYTTLKTTLGALDTEIYTNFDEMGVVDTYISDQTLLDMDTITVFVTEFDTYTSNFGFNEDFLEQTVTYVDRDAYSTDELRDEDTSYVVESDAIQGAIDSIDSLITDPEILIILSEFLTPDPYEDENGNLITPETVYYDSFTEILFEFVAENLATDEVMNTILSFYPLIQEIIIQAIYDGVSSAGDTLAYLVSSLTGTVMDSALSSNGLALWPESLADIIEDTYGSEYASAIDDLNASDNDWRDSAIYDEETGKFTVDWGIDEKIAELDAQGAEPGEKLEVFVGAMAAVLEGLFPVIEALLLNQDFSATVLSIIKITLSESEGYVNILGVIFEMLGFYDYSTTFSGIDNAKDLLELILSELTTALDNLFEAPLNNILELIPELMYFMSFDLIGYLLDQLETDIGVYGIKVYTLNIGSLVDLEDLAGVVTDDGIGGMLDSVGIDISGLGLDEGYLATLGTWTTVESSKQESFCGDYSPSGEVYTLEGNVPDVLYYLLDTILLGLKTGEIFDVLNAFMDEEEIASLKETVYSFLNPNATSTDIIAAIVELFEPMKYSEASYVTFEEVVKSASETITDDGTSYTVAFDEVLVYDETTGTYSVEKVEDPYGVYTDYWTEEKAEYMMDTLPTFLYDIADILMIDLEGEIAGLISGFYTAENLQSLLDMIQPLISEESLISLLGEDIYGLLEFADNNINVDLVDIIEHIQTYTISEDFVEGDQDSFIAEIIAFLSPISPVLELFLFSSEDKGTIKILNDGVELLSYNGYESAILPIYEALGITTMPTYTELLANEGDDLLNALVEPLIEQISFILYGDSQATQIADENATDSVIYRILEVLPNIIYFVECGALNSSIVNLIRPVYAVLDAIRPIYDFDMPINDSDFDLAYIIDGLLEDASTSDFVIPSFTSLSAIIENIGETQERTSVSGETYNYLVVSEDDYAELVTAMLYEFIDGITIMENIQPYIDLVSSLGSFATDLLGQEELAQLLVNLGELETTDQIMFILYYVSYGADVAVDSLDEVKELITVEIEEIFELIGGFSSDTYVEIADATLDLVNNLKEQFEDLGINTESLNFFEKIIQAIKEFFEMIGDFFGI